MTRHRISFAHTIHTLVAAIVIALALCSTASAYPSGVADGKGSVDWSVGGVLIWRFPASDASMVRALSDRFDALYKKGFALPDLAVKKDGKKWALFVGKTKLFTAEKSHARGAGTDPKVIATMCLSRLYDAAASLCADDLTDRYKLQGGHSITSTVSWYGGKFIGRKCANGEVLTETHLCAAAKSLPFGTLVRVTVPKTNRSVVVRVTDRFAEHKGRALDVSTAAADILGIKRMGVARVQIEVLGRVARFAERR